MKNKIVSLILGLFVILATTAFTSCERTAVKNVEKTEISADVSNALYVAPEVAQCRDVAYVTIADDVTDQVVPVDPAWETRLMIISSIITVVLTLLTVLFKSKSNKAEKVINEIWLALADKKVTTDELKKIIAAWKGE